MTIQTLNKITDSDKALLKKGNYITYSKLIVSDNIINTDSITLENYLVLTESNSIKFWEETEERYKEDEGFIGQFIARTLTGELQNVSDDFNIENKYITLLLGISKLSKTTTTTTWYSLGTFLVSKPEDDDVKDNTTFEAFDLTTLFNKTFNPEYTDSTYTTSFKDLIASGKSMTALELAKYVCNQVGIILDTSYNFINYDFKIDSNQFTSNSTCRDVMKAIAKLGFGFAEIGWDNKCRISTINTNQDTILDENKLTNDDYYSLTVQNKYGDVNSVYVGISDVEGEGVEETYPEILPSDTKKVQIQILDNPITYTFELRREMINNAIDKLNNCIFGLGYTPIEMETPGHIWWDSTEPIEIKQMDGTLINTYPFNRVITYGGNIKTSIYSYAKTDVEEKVGYDKDFYTELRDTRLQVNKQNGTIIAQAGQINTQGELINGVRETLSEQEKQIEVLGTNIDENGNITEVTTKKGFTFNDSGLNIYTGKNSYNTTITNEGTYYQNGENILVQTTRSGSVIVNLSEQGVHQYSYDGYNEYGFIDERIEVDGEYCYATFYNRED